MEIQFLLASAMHAYGFSTYYALDMSGAVRKDRARVKFRTNVHESVEQRAPGTAAGPTSIFVDNARSVYRLRQTSTYIVEQDA